ncbi:MAG: hypothetical protein Q8L56_03875 [Rhodocyclaceae bacterium]|nr:hypothetical protein [Rhodocyclaceae bacterium]
MLDWFIEWTTQLNQTDHLLFGLVTVLTMALTGIGIAGLVELLLKGMGAGKSGAPDHHH